MGYGIYTDGELKREWGYCPDAIKGIPVGNLKSLSDEEKAQYNLYKIIINKPQLQPWQIHSASPTITFENNQIVKTYSVIDIGLDKFKERKNQEFKNIYFQLSNEGFITSLGIKLDCRESDKINWLVASTDDTKKTRVKDYNNVIHETTITQFDNMYNELKNYYDKLLNNKWILNTAVDTSTSYEEVNNLYWRKWIVTNEETGEGYFEYNPILEG